MVGVLCVASAGTSLVLGCATKKVKKTTFNRPFERLLAEDGVHRAWNDWYKSLSCEPEDGASTDEQQRVYRRCIDALIATDKVAVASDATYADKFEKWSEQADKEGSLQSGKEVYLFVLAQIDPFMAECYADEIIREADVVEYFSSMYGESELLNIAKELLYAYTDHGEMNYSYLSAQVAFESKDYLSAYRFLSYEVSVKGCDVAEVCKLRQDAVLAFGTGDDGYEYNNLTGIRDRIEQGAATPEEKLHFDRRYQDLHQTIMFTVLGVRVEAEACLQRAQARR